MSSEARKKLHERFLLDLFLGEGGIKPKTILQLAPPDPDFVIDLDGRMIGIELTEIFIRSDKSSKHARPGEEMLPQEVESITNLIVSEAREIYFASNDTLVLCKILFSSATPDKRKVKQIAQMIAHKIRDMVSEDFSNAVDWKPYLHDKESRLLSEAVGFIHIYRVPEMRFARWTVMRPGIVTSLTPEHLQARIDSKAQKLNGYKRNKNIEEFWLLMVADRTRPSQKFLRKPGFALESLSSPFDKTFYYCHAAEEPLLEI